jgi:GH15 family glucan-1,4-alpha-glucosidase
VETQGLDGPVERWRAIRDEIQRDVCEQGFNKKLGSFTQSYGTKELDASLLLIPLVGFLPASDPRVRGTVDAIERGLVEHGFVLRYRTHESDVDGLPPNEGVFLPCSFWLVDCLELLGRHDDARALFDRLLTLTNDLGLLSEEYDPVGGRMLGNFPQAFTHLALVNSAFNLMPHLPSPMKRRHAGPS